MKKKILYVVAGVVAVVVVLVVVSLVSPSAEVSYNNGQHALLTGQYDKAREYLTKALKHSKNPDLTGEILVSLGMCSLKEGKDDWKDYMRQAALLQNRKGIAGYEEYLKQFPEQKQEYMAFYGEMASRNPGNSYYAAKLARMYLFDQDFVDISKAGSYLLPFVSQSGSGSGGVNTLAYAAYLLGFGAGGYVESPESAIMQSGKCKKDIDRVLRDVDVDAEALNILGDMALAECAYESNSKLIENIVAAGRFYEAAAERANPQLKAAIVPKLNLIEEIRTEMSKVVISPNWWDKKPNDWTGFFNDQTGFRYVGHTNASGDIHAPSGITEYPTGWGIGAWTKEKNVFVGRWKNGQIDRGIWVGPECYAQMYQS